MLSTIIFQGFVQIHSISYRVYLTDLSMTSCLAVLASTENKDIPAVTFLPWRSRRDVPAVIIYIKLVCKITQLIQCSSSENLIGEQVMPAFKIKVRNLVFFFWRGGCVHADDITYKWNRIQIRRVLSQIWTDSISRIKKKKWKDA